MTAGLCLFFASCGPFSVEPTVDLETMTAQEIYALGEQDLADGDPTSAAFYFSEIERLYPYSEWTKQALIMRTFAYHEAQDYERSRMAAQRFIDYHPADEDAAYAQYLLALSYYDQIDEIGRDQTLAREALRELRTLIERYPDSEFVATAREQFELAFNHVAAKEMEIGRFYLRKGHFAAAAKRFRIVVEEYQTTRYTPEALLRLVEVYLSLGLTTDAEAATAILGLQYSETEWYADSAALLEERGLAEQAEGSSWLAQIYRQMILGEWI